MTRLLEINSCYDCPHHWNPEDKSTEYCTYNEETERKINTPTWESIDKNCPLPVKERMINMTRLAEIHNCFTCPHYDEDSEGNNYCCYGDNDIKLDIDVCFEIDKNCPLPFEKEEIIKVNSCSDCTNPRMMNRTKVVVCDVDDNMSKNSLIKRIREKYNEYDELHNQFYKEMAYDNYIEMNIDKENNVIRIMVSVRDGREYTEAYHKFKNIEETYGEFDYYNWSSIQITGQYKL